MLKVDINPEGFETDKHPSMCAAYEEMVRRLRRPVRSILELGVAAGGSIHMWSAAFPDATVVGVDRKDVKRDNSALTARDVHFYRGEQDDPELLQKVAAAHGPFGFIVDDCAHEAEPARRSLWLLWEHLRPGGFYALEDWGTGYWPGWPDGGDYSGPDHMAGMGGLVKELVDEVGVRARTHPKHGTPPWRGPRIARLVVLPGLVFLVKGGWPCG